jgi:hypothetical protein
MNERIRELVEQVGAVRNVMAMGRHDGVLFTEFELEKFAELIVRESIVDFYRRYLDLESEEDITEQVNRYVKDNFGVEE